MKKAGLIVIIILLTGIIAFYLLKSKPTSNVQLVKFKGVESISNFSKDHLAWFSNVDSTDKINAVPAQVNDLIYGFSSDNIENLFLFKITKQSDKVSTIRCDSLGAFVEGRLVTLYVDNNESAVANWLDHSSKDDFRYLQSVFISDSLSELSLQQLKTIGQSASDIGLMIDSDSKYLTQVEKLFNPSWLWISDVNISDEAVSEWSKMDHLEQLILSDVNMENIKYDGLKNLKILHINNPDSFYISQLSQLPKGLSALQISKADMRDLDFLQDRVQLKEVSFNDCSEIRDISSLTTLPHLTVLSFANCDSIPDLNSLSGLHELRWFAPPANISEQELASIVSNNPDLETLVLIGCNHIKSLEMLKDLDQLSFLTVLKSPLVADSLFRFQHLKYLAFAANDSNDSLSIGKLQKQLPNTLVTTAEPFCMGSGWLIVFFGLIILLTLVILRVKTNISLK